MNQADDSSSSASNSQTGTAYTLVRSDVGMMVELNNAAAITLTIPASTLVSWPAFAELRIYQQGAGQVTVTAGAGVTLRASGTKVKTAAQFAVGYLRMRTTDEWVWSGDISV
jgi:hypothetical protein